jgi:hypothetical protein
MDKTEQAKVFSSLSNLIAEILIGVEAHGEVNRNETQQEHRAQAKLDHGKHRHYPPSHGLVVNEAFP